jgi:hypothetical protein
VSYSKKFRFGGMTGRLQRNLESESRPLDGRQNQVGIGMARYAIRHAARLGVVAAGQ